jgi:hypothetical protein
MPKAPAKTVRFAKVVATSGQPEPYTLWSAPEKDRPFQTALKQHRVMTVHQANTGSKADYGEVGFDAAEHGSLLLFPKTLKPFEGQKVVGVKYDLLAEAREPKDPVEIKPPKEPKRAKAERPTRGSPAETFLRIFRPEEEEEPPKKARRQKPEARERMREVQAPRDDAAKDLAMLEKAVRKAMSQLQAGKAVAGYQTLEKAIGR